MRSPVIMVVARSESALYRYLHERFAEEPEVEVAVDRRHGERRQRHVPTQVERRQSNRRQRNVDALLKAVGWAVIGRVSPERTAT